MRTSILVALVAIAGAAGVSAQGPARGKAQATINGKSVSIDYGRPSLKGRDMLAQAPPGTVWRMGSNEATTITSEGDLVFGSVTIPKGSYSLFAKRVDANNWQLVFNKQTGQWGTEHDAKQDLTSVPLKVEPASAGTETLTIALAPVATGGEFKLSWGSQILKASFSVK